MRKPRLGTLIMNRNGTKIELHIYDREALEFIIKSLIGNISNENAELTNLIINKKEITTLPTKTVEEKELIKSDSNSYEGIDDVSELPDYIRDNPWVSVLKNRSKEELLVTV